VQTDFNKQNSQTSTTTSTLQVPHPGSQDDHKVQKHSLPRSSSSTGDRLIHSFIFFFLPLTFLYFYFSFYFSCNY